MQDVVKVQYALLVDPLTGREFNLARYATSVGRAVSCDIVLTDKSVSRQHCIFYCLKGKFYVEDCGSTNGTTLNGEYLEGRKEVKPGDEVRVGLTPLIFLLMVDRNNTALFIEQTPTHEHPAEDMPAKRVDRECAASRLARLTR